MHEADGVLHHQECTWRFFLHKAEAGQNFLSYKSCRSGMRPILDPRDWRGTLSRCRWRAITRALAHRDVWTAPVSWQRAPAVP
jgi:hypothetical protein